MKSKLMKGLVIVALAGSLTACEMDRQQRHTATGAAIGGVAGGLLGGDIATTLGGAALGGVIGSQVNKGGDYDDREYRHHKKHKRHHHHRINRDYHQPRSFIHNPPTPNQMTNERMETIKLTPHH